MKQITVILTGLLAAISVAETSAQWVQTNAPSGSGGVVFAVGFSGSNLFAGRYEGGGVYLSTDNGGSWTPVDSGLTGPPAISALIVSGTNLFAGAVSGTIPPDTRGRNGIYLSTNNGTNWARLTAGQVRALAISGETFLAGTEDGKGILLSTDNGTHWTQVDSGLTSTVGDPHIVSSLAVLGTNVFAGTYGGVFVTADSGRSWAPVSVGLTDLMIRSLAVSGTNLFAGTQGGCVFLSTDGGKDWTEVNPGVTKSSVTSFAVCGTNLFAGTSGEGVFLTTNSGASWTPVNSGLTEAWVSSFAVSGTNLFAGINSGVWRRSLSEMITSVVTTVGIPVQFGLDQNYPNPFNSSTTIKYELPKSSMVMLSVYDILGSEVTVLVNERKNAGSYEVKFDAAGVSSGVYFYRIQAGDFTQTKRLLLVK